MPGQMLPGSEQGGQRLAAIERRGVVLFGQLVAAGIDHQRHVHDTRHRQIQLPSIERDMNCTDSR